MDTHPRLTEVGPGSGRGGRKGTSPICPCHCFHRRSSSHVSCASAWASREPGHRGLCRPGTSHVAHVQGAGTIHAGQWQDPHLAARPQEDPTPVPHGPPAPSLHGVLTTTVCSNRRDQPAVISLQVQGKAWSCSSDSEPSDLARLVHAPGALSALSQAGSPSRTRRLREALTVEVAQSLSSHSGSSSFHRRLTQGWVLPGVHRTGWG